MITNECVYNAIYLVNAVFDCSLCDMILSSGGQPMITYECLQCILFALSLLIVLFVA